MSILDLQDVAYKRIRSQRISERFLSILKALGLVAFDIRRTKVDPEVIVKVTGAMLRL